MYISNFFYLSNFSLSILFLTPFSCRLPEGRVPAVSLNVSTLKRGLLVSFAFFENIFEMLENMCWLNTYLLTTLKIFVHLKNI